MPIRPRPFALFGWDHLVSLAVTAAGVCWSARLARRGPREGRARALRFGLAAALLAGLGGLLLAEGSSRPLSIWDFLPLHLCDLLIFVAAFALLTRGQHAYELLYFWAAGAMLAMLTPDVGHGFPDRDFLAFFGFHGAVVVAAAVLTFGLGMRPRDGAAWRVWGFTNAYAVVVGIVDATTGANFLYLRAKPEAVTLLDRLGPWPCYIVVADILALGLFVVLERALPVEGPGSG